MNKFKKICLPTKQKVNKKINNPPKQICTNCI